MKQREIYLVRWDPSVGHEYQKIRPGIVLSSEEILKTSNLITFVALTKKTDSPIQDDILIKKDTVNHLTHDSLIKVHHISSFDQQRVVKYVGEVEEKVLKQIKNYLKKHFNL